MSTKLCEKRETSNMSPPKDAVDNCNIDTLLMGAYNKIQLEGINTFIVLVGSTGTGKSTLLKFLCEDPSLIISENEQNDFIFEDAEDTIGTDSFVSMTLHPESLIHKDRGIHIIDCPGFEDSRGARDDIVAALIIKLILEKAKYLKIVFVENFSKLKLNEDRSAFLSALGHLSQLIKYNVESLDGSIALIATKIDSAKSDRILLNSIKVFLKSAIEHLEKEAVEQPSEKLHTQIRLAKLLFNDENFQIFRRPADIDEFPWKMDSLKSNLKEMQSMIFEKLAFSQKIKNPFNATLAPETIVHIVEKEFPDTLKVLTEELCNIKELLKMHFDDSFSIDSVKTAEGIKNNIKKCEDCISGMQYVDSIEKLTSYVKDKLQRNYILDNLNIQKVKLSFFCDVSNKSFHEIENEILKQVKEPIDSHGQSAFKFHTFLLQFYKEIEKYDVRLHNDKLRVFMCDLNTDSDISMLRRLDDFGFSDGIATLASDFNFDPKQVQMLVALGQEKTQFPLQIIPTGNSIIYSGRFVILSQILDPISNEHKSAHEIIILARETFYVDCDISLIDTHLTILSPFLEIVEKERTIFLQGSCGIFHRQRKAANSLSHNSCGSDGLDGNSGFSSGKIHIFSLQIKNVHLLKVYSKGGIGSDGQEGGDGKDAAQEINNDDDTSDTEVFASDGSIRNDTSSIIETFGENASFSYWTLLYMLTLHRVENVEQKVKVTKRGKTGPTDGGKGGNGGSGSIPGSSKFVVKNCTTPVNFFPSIGQSGSPGRGGKAGENFAIGVEKSYDYTTTRYINILPLNSFYNNDYKYNPDGTIRISRSKYKQPKNGLNGDSAKQAKKVNYKYYDANMVVEIMMNYCECIVTDPFVLRDCHGTKEFMNYVLSELKNHFREKDYKEIIKACKTYKTKENYEFVISELNSAMQLHTYTNTELTDWFFMK